jgi:hypothetical protein
MLAGLTWPSLWAASSMVFDYHYGFGKHGLFGALLASFIEPPYRYASLAALAFGIFALWLGLLCAASWPAMRRDGGVAAAGILFFLSAGFASLVSDMGYLEHVGLALTLACLLLPAGFVWLPARATLALAAVLFHEANFVIFVPIIALDLWGTMRFRLCWRAIVVVTACCVPGLLACWYLGNVRTACQEAGALAYFRSLASDFVVRADTVEALCRNGWQNFSMMRTMVWAYAVPYGYLAMALCVTLPSTIFNLGLIGRVMPQGEWAGRRMLLAAAMVAVFGPVGLNVIAADLVRFVSLVQVTSLLVLVSAVRRVGLPAGGCLPLAWRPHARGIAVSLAVFELSTALVMTNGAPMMKFPFVPLVAHAMAALHGDSAFLVIPAF